MEFIALYVHYIREVDNEVFTLSSYPTMTYLITIIKISKQLIQHFLFTFQNISKL
jgi:hypothetical protein